MDKSWMQLRNRLSPEYTKGVQDFLDFAWDRVSIEGNMICPCIKCNNVLMRTREDVHADLIIYGIAKNYTTWFHHGEEFSYNKEVLQNDSDEEDCDDMIGMIGDAFGVSNMEGDALDGLNGGIHDQPSKEADKFYKLLGDAKQKLYTGCEKFSKLSFIVKLLHIKCLNGWSNKSFTMLLGLLRVALPEGETLPNSYNEAKKIIRDLGLDYVKIDACPNDCMLFWKKDSNANECAICGANRWKVDGDEHERASSSNKKTKKVPNKILRYFPLKPRLQRLFMSSKTAKDMTWHHRERVKDGVLRHPADAEAWTDFDLRHTAFASDPRNVRLGLASDGFNPFGNMSISHSTWPVVLVPYNLPPWMCMKQPFLMLSLLIPGPKAPGNKIDVYLQPLIDDLKELWDVGIETYDAFTKQNFMMHAAVLWTINDFPAYANLSGWSTKGKLACPTCNINTEFFYLPFGKKMCYMGHRRWLPQDHKWRYDKKRFNGKTEYRTPPMILSGDDVLEQLHDIESGESIIETNWRKKSIFFELPYWRTLLIRHNLDVMHIEKNVCDNVLGTLLNMDGKTKDNEKSRRDLKKMKIRKALHLKKDEKDGNKIVCPPACYTMSKNGKIEFCQFLKDIKVPDGYSSNISRCAQPKERKVIGLKSHDCHVLMQRLLPLAIRGLLPQQVFEPLSELSNFFRNLCSKVLWKDELERLESQIALTLCKLEMIFPPSFFDVMEHLPIHLAGEAKLAGPVHYRWMYFIERNLRTLKSYVRNKSRPEGSIAEGYLAEECLTFCSRYLNDIETRFNHPERNYDRRDTESVIELSAFRKNGRFIGSPIYRALNKEELELAQFCVLQNCDEVLSYIEEHQQLVGSDRLHKKHFSTWFFKKVTQLYNEGTGQVSEQLLSLARGCNQDVACYKGYIVNGFRFHTKDHERRLKTQNSGVKVAGDISSGENANTWGNVEYYGVLTDIIELQYLGGRRIVLFKCDWWDVFSEGQGVTKDAHGFTSVNFSKTLRTNEPFVLACLAEQVFYVKDNIKQGWHVIVNTQPRDFFNMPPIMEDKEQPMEDNEDPFQQNECYGQSISLDNEYDNVVWTRNDMNDEHDG